MKKTLIAISLMISMVSLAQDLNCIDVDGKTYGADEYTQAFIRNVVNRNSVNCGSPTVIRLAKRAGKKINVSRATNSQRQTVFNAMEKLRASRDMKKLRKHGYAK